jgi:effector-binding domain-containing protein
MSRQYQVSTSTVAARPLLAVRARLGFEELPTQIPVLLKRVYDAAGGQDLLDGQNVVVYRGDPPGFDVEIGVGLKGRPEPREGLVVTATPAGEAAQTTHWGEYSELHRAHQTIIAWCVANERALAGVNWEVYGHWSEDPSKRRTDVYYLLAPD